MSTMNPKNSCNRVLYVGHLQKLKRQNREALSKPLDFGPPDALRLMHFDFQVAVLGSFACGHTPEQGMA